MAKSALRRHHRARVIARRRAIVRNVWHTLRDPFEGYPYDERPGFLDKHNLVCSCGICRRPKWRQRRHLERAQMRRQLGAVIEVG